MNNNNSKHSVFIDGEEYINLNDLRRIINERIKEYHEQRTINADKEWLTVFYTGCENSLTDLNNTTLRTL